ncbi:MAG: hypothetical protein ABIK73_02025 [candidate division WOR-3 bacterium]
MNRPVQSIEQHNNKQNINNKQRAIYKKELQRIASWGNKKIHKDLTGTFISFIIFQKLVYRIRDKLLRTVVMEEI